MTCRYKLEHVADSIKKHAMQSLENHNNVECYMKYEDRQLKLKEQVTVVRECIINHQRAIQLVYIFIWIFFVKHLLSVERKKMVKKSSS